jgi:hypothetical protein
MLYMIEGAQAEDEGSCWEDQRDGSRYSRVQVRDISLGLLQDDLRALSVGTELIVDSALAQEIETLVPALRGLDRRAVVVGPQPLSVRKADMVQICPTAKVRLAKVSIERDEAGKAVKLKTPFVLDVQSQVAEPTICRIEENQLTVFSAAIKDLIAGAEPRLAFRTVRYENEPEPAVKPVKAFRMPSLEELKRRR